MKKTVKTLTLTIAALVLSLLNVLAIETEELTSANLEITMEAVVEDAVSLQEWMIEPPAAEKVIEIEDWMLQPIEMVQNETGLTLEEWMLQPIEMVQN